MNTQTQTTEKTNDLRHTIIASDKDGNYMDIKIRLNDECKNGHQDFAITATIYEKGKPRTDRYMIAAGCCHDEIVESKPELKIFVNLHSCDWEGIPMYAIENGFFHLKNGFNDEKPDMPVFKEKFCEYYRLTDLQFDQLKTCKNQLQYALKLQELGILKQWKQEADTAISLLESMTGKSFVVDSRKTQFNAPTPEAIKEEQEKQEAGYYTTEAEAQREQEKQKGILLDLEAARDKDIKMAVEEFEVKKQVLLTGGEKALRNCIFHNHSRTLSFNWKSYDFISNELYEKIKSAIQLPEGVKIENKKGNS